MIGVRVRSRARTATSATFEFSADEPGVDVRVLARRRGVRSLHVAPRRTPGSRSGRTTCASARPTWPATSTPRRRARVDDRAGHDGAARRRSARGPPATTSSTNATFAFIADEAGLDVRVLARRRRVRRLHVAEGLQRPGGRCARVPGPRDGRGGQHRRLAGDATPGRSTPACASVDGRRRPRLLGAAERLREQLRHRLEPQGRQQVRLTATPARWSGSRSRRSPPGAR